ncbi:MAG: PAS domain-containing protein [Thermoleophilia bacterium]|nr:PAS domain-containing protein [Thermoleophilia bacterium]
MRREPGAPPAAREAVIDLLPDLVAMAGAIRDAAGEVVDVEVLDANAAVAAFLGRPVGAVIGRRLGELLPERAARRVVRRVRRAVSGGVAVDRLVRPISQGPGVPPLLRERIIAVDERRAIYQATPVGPFEDTLAGQVLAAVGTGVLVLAAGGRVMLCNDAAAAVLGVDADVAVDARLADLGVTLVDDAGAPLAPGRAPGEACLLTGEPQRAMQLGVRRPDGDTVWVEMGATALGSGLAAPAAAVVTVIDVTTRRAAERELEAGRELFQALVEHVPDAVLRFDPDLRFVYANPAARRAIGRPLEAIVGRTMRELGYGTPELIARWEANRAGAVRLGEERSEAYPLRVPGLGERWFSTRLVPERGPGGEVASLLVIARDVTDQHREGLEQDALRRVATAVAGGQDAEAVFAIVAAESARLIGGDAAGVTRFLPGGRGRVVGAWCEADVVTLEVGDLVRLDDEDPAVARLRDGLGARLEDSDQIAGSAGEQPLRSALWAPVVVGRRVWGFLSLSHRDPGFFSVDHEARLARFADLAALAVAADRGGAPDESWGGDHLPLLAHLVRTGRLSDRAADLLTLRFGLDGAPPMALPEAAQELRMDPSEAERDLGRALRRLAAAMLHAVDDLADAGPD